MSVATNQSRRQFRMRQRSQRAAPQKNRMLALCSSWPPGLSETFDVDPDRENRCGQSDQDVASEVEPVQTDGNDDRLPVDEVALELTVHP